MIRKRNYSRRGSGSSYDYSQEMDDILYHYNVTIGSATAGEFYQNTISLVAAGLTNGLIDCLKRHGFILRQTMDMTPSMIVSGETQFLYYFTTDPRRYGEKVSEENDEETMDLDNV